MPSRLIPLFPLGVVIFPRTSLPLHIFEERYKEMVGNAIRDNSEFGIVLAKDDGIVNAGCTVAVEKVLHMYPDGRMDIQARGKNRFEIVSLNDEKTYLQAEVNLFEDDDLQQPPEDLRTRVVGHLQSLRQLSSHEGRGEPDLSDPQVSFQVAQFIPDVDFLSAILRQRSEARRLKELNDFLDSYIPKLQATERMRRLAPTNGSGVRPAGL